MGGFFWHLYGNHEAVGEDGFVKEFTRKGFYSVPSDHARNISVYSAYRYDSKKHPKQSAPIQREFPRNTHLVCFVMSDGDNVGFNLDAMYDDNRWGAAPERGRFPVGWGISAALCELASVALKAHYELAGQKGDSFVCMGGQGYAYPSDFEKSVFKTYAAQLAKLMKKSGLKILQIIDNDAFSNDHVWNEFLKYPEVEGMIYLDYSLYHKGDGQIRFINGKPLIAAKASFWEGLNGGPGRVGSSAQEIADYVNSAPKDLSNPKSYTLISVHVWTKTLKDLTELAGKFGDNVIIADPQSFFRGAGKNLKKN